MINFYKISLYTLAAMMFFIQNIHVLAYCHLDLVYRFMYFLLAADVV